MDEFIESTLDSWDMGELKETFQSQGIDQSIFADLDEVAIKELIPKLGLRIKFLKKYQALYAQKENVNPGDKEVSESNVSTDDAVSESQSTENASTPSSSSNPLIKNCSVLRTLKRSLLGTEILHIYQKRKTLNCSLRAKLVDCIITEELKKSDSKKISTERFFELRNEIKAIFPSEHKSLYYIPYIKQDGKVSLAKGKLWAKYYNTRRTLKKLGIIKSTSETVNEAIGAAEDPVDYQPSAEEIEKLEWLKHSHEPWDQIVEYWRFTYSIRAIKYTDETTVYDYLQTYPALKQNKGYILLENDFSIKFPEKELNLFANWPHYRDKLIAYAKTTNKVGCQNCLDVLNVCNTEDAQTLVALRLIPLLVPVVSTHKKKRTSFRSSNAEMQESFLARIDTVSDLQPMVEKRRKAFHQSKLTIQPYVVIVGQSLQKIDASYLVIEDITYLLETPLKAVDICFKSYFALSASYTAWSEQAWLFLQKVVYKIDTKWDDDRQIPSGLLAFFTDIENQI